MLVRNICRSYTTVRGTFIQHNTICLVIHAKSLDNSVTKEIVNINHIITIFAAIVPYTCMIIIIYKIWQETDHICKSTIKKSNGPTFADLNIGALNLRCPWDVYKGSEEVNLM